MSANVAPSALVPRLLLGLRADGDPHLRIDGTAVLVDISGFTTLSEQLAAAGREGTEQLIATLSRIFTVLLPATDDGGDVVKFAGDALLRPLLRRGPREARRARRLEHEPRARRHRRHPPAERAHAGCGCRWACTRERSSCSSPAREYVSVVMTGRDTTRVLELQAAAERRPILVSDETAALLPRSRWRPIPRRRARTGCCAPDRRDRDPHGAERGAARAADRFLPRAFAQRPDLLGAEPDHRWAAIGFVQVSGRAGLRRRGRPGRAWPS